MSRLLTRFAPALFCLACLSPLSHADSSAAGDNPSNTTTSAPTQRELMRQRWQAMTPEQKAAAKAKFKDRLASMPPEQRQQLLQRMQQQRDANAAPAAP